MRKQLLLLTIVLSAVMLLSACSNTVIGNAPVESIVASTPSASPAQTMTQTPTPTPTVAQPTPDMRASDQNSVTVVDLYNEFISDVQTATSKYTGESVVSTGVVTRTGPDIHGTPSIELSDAVGGKVYVLYVVNSFDQLDEVAVGETVTMKGNFHIFSSGEWGVVIKQGEVIERE